MKKIIIALGFLGILGGSLTTAFAGYFNTTPVNRCDTQITQTLQIGSENNDVYVLQNMLAQGGYLYANPNGHFGPSTKAAVKRFQNENSLSATGIVGEATRNAINERLCDIDVRGDSTSYNIYGNTYGTTYVDQYDPYARVISPQVTTPVVYSTPQENAISSFSTILNSSPVSLVSPVTVPSYSSNGYQANPINLIVPATNQIQGTNIVFNPSTGYSYGLTQTTGTLTIVTPGVNAVYREGDTVNLTWTTNNLNATGFVILLENTSTSQSKQVTVTSGSSVSFVLTKELLDAVCVGSCNPDQQKMFRIVISTPVTDIAGVTSNFRAAVSPITIRRPYGVTATVRISTSKSPVDSGEKFRLYVNIPQTDSWNTDLQGESVVKIHALCVNNVQVNVAGVPCAQDLVMPASVLTAQQGIPATITNTTWYKQDVTFEMTVTSLSGQVIGTARTTVTANSAPFTW